jgi:flagellin-like hook-associated protein FlgL
VSGLSSTLQTVLAVQNALIGQLLEQGGGASLVEHMFTRQSKSGREIMAEALTGTMRADAGMYRQAALNAMEGKSIADILHTAAQGMQQSLGTMIGALNDPTFGANQTLQDRYIAAREDMEKLAANTEYNGIKLLDGTSPKIDIYIGKTHKEIALDNVAGWIASAVPDKDTAVKDPATALSTLENSLNDLKLKDSSWQAMGAGFKTSAEALERQAKIYDLTAARSILGARADPSDRLLNALLSDQGRLMNFLT